MLVKENAVNNKKMIKMMKWIEIIYNIKCRKIEYLEYVIRNQHLYSVLQLRKSFARQSLLISTDRMRAHAMNFSVWLHKRNSKGHWRSSKQEKPWDGLYPMVKRKSLHYKIQKTSPSLKIVYKDCTVSVNYVVVGMIWF